MLSKNIIKYIQSLSHKKLRESEHAFVAEGPKVVAEFLQSENYRCKILCASREWLSVHHLLTKDISKDNIYAVDEVSLKKISRLTTPNELLAVFEEWPVSQRMVKLENTISLMLDDIRDPGNMGTIIRIADWFGIGQVICSENCVDCYNSKVVQATMGSLARVRVTYTDLVALIDRYPGVNVYAATLSGTPLETINKIREGIILIGNESSGINKDLQARATQQITIPKYGKAESLNAAVAAGIIVAHLK